MSGLELNKIAGAVLLAGLIAMAVGIFSDVLYDPEESPEKRGFQVAVAEENNASSAKKEEVIDIASLLNNADIDAGKKLTKKCVACHSFDQGGPNKVGPALWGILNRGKASHEGFSYSDALASKGGNWDYDALFAFINKPRDFVPGTKMAFAGIKKPEQIADLIVYLRSLGHNDVPLPAAATSTPEPEAQAIDATVQEEAPAEEATTSEESSEEL